MQTLVQTEHKRLVKKFHILLGKAGLGADEKVDLLMSNYGVVSSLDLSVAQLIEICELLDLRTNPKAAEMDKYRKRLIASIGGWLRAIRRTENIQIIKGIACRASGRDSFNEIPLEQLRSLYNAFNKKRKDLKMVEELTAESIEFLTINN
jgi:hypothetical protein